MKIATMNVQQDYADCYTSWQATQTASDSNLSDLC